MEIFNNRVKKIGFNKYQRQIIIHLQASRNLIYSNRTIIKAVTVILVKPFRSLLSPPAVYIITITFRTFFLTSNKRNLVLKIYLMII